MSEISPGLDSAPKTITPPAREKKSVLSKLSEIFRKNAQPQAENVVSAAARREALEQRKANIRAFPDYRVGPEDNRLVDQINAELKELDVQEGKEKAA